MFCRAFARFPLLSTLVLSSTASFAQSQDRLAVPAVTLGQPQPSQQTTLPMAIQTPITSLFTEDPSPTAGCFTGTCKNSTGFITGNTNFQNFIGFISNPVQSIDPRSTTEIVAMFGNGWVSADHSILPSGTLQVYGGGPMAIALTDRLCIGLNDGGYAVANFSRDRFNLLRKLGLPIPAYDVAGQREGWLNLGGYVQYTLIANVEKQFILTAGMRWEAPAGATEVFQGGANPAYLAPYVTIGKEFGNYHFLATTGYEFPAGSGDSTTNTAYLNLHFDRKIGWFYPLIELNGAYHTSSTNISLNTPHHDVIDLGTFETSGNNLTGAFGANAVIIPNKFELGAVYLRPLTAQGHFEYNGLLVKATYRF